VTGGRTTLRLRALAGIVAFMFATLVTRLWFLQVLAVEKAKHDAANNATRLVSVPAPRGQIIDDRGEPLVTNRMSLEVTVNRQEAGDQLESVLYRLSQVLGVSAEELGRRAEDVRYYSYQPVPVAVDVSRRVDFYISEHADEFQGVQVVPVPVRRYPQGSLAAHVLGYLGQINEAQLREPAFANYRAGDEIGVTGVEAVYEHDLQGKKGWVKYRVNSADHNLGELGQQPPVPGDTVQLTLDLGIQRLAEDTLKAGIEHARTVVDTSTGQLLRANAGAIVVLDPTTGAIQAIASYPTYDPSYFTRNHTTAQLKRRFGAQNGYPLLDRAIQGVYPPGSTYKPWIALSALSRHLVSTTQGYSCPATWEVPGDPQHHVFHNWSTTSLGTMSIARALAESCDTIFYPIGYDYWGIYYPPPSADGVPGNDDQPPKEPLQHDLRAIGFGRPTNVDLPHEYAGRVPDAEWKAAIHKANPKAFPDGQWYPGDFVNMSIGQGDTLVTPLQLAVAFGALENGGRVCTPHLLDEVTTPRGRLIRRSSARCSRRFPFPAADVSYVRNALTGVVQYGTAASAFQGFPFSQVWVAGKTGTAQVANRQDYSWFAAMTAAHGEQHVIVCLVEQGGHGSTTAAPIVRHVIEGLYGLPSTGYLTVAGTD
jgi:penicillin-binding protein 2